MCFLTTQKAGTHTSHGNFSSIRLFSATATESQLRFLTASTMGTAHTSQSIQFKELKVH